MADSVRSPSTQLIFLCAILYAALTLAFLGGRPITRAQEARVLETSRQMLAAPDWHGWLVPQLNGEARLRKPPLCYWYTAASYRVIGVVDEFAGRLPTLVIGWACVVVTFFFGRDLLGRRGGFLAAAVLASGHYFIEYSRSAETDMPATLGVIVACWGMARASLPPSYTGEGWGGGRSSDDALAARTSLDASSPCLPALPPRTGGRLWFNVAAVGIAFAAMTKGAPAIFPIVFLGLLCWAVRSGAPAMRFLVSGAPITALVLIVPWFAYAMSDPAAGQVGEEIVVVTSGRNHRGLFINYVPIVLHMLLPWTPVLIAAFFVKPLRRIPNDLPGRVALCVLLCVLLPLCVTLNVQAHYLVPTLPGFALVIAWTLTRALEALDDRAKANALRVKLAVTFAMSWRLAIGALVVAGVGVLVVQAVRHHTLARFDLAAGSALLLAAFIGHLFGRRRDASTRVMLFASMSMLVMPIVGGWWAPTFNGDHGHEVAAAIRDQVGNRPLVGWGESSDISLSFDLRQAIVWLIDGNRLREQLAREPDTIVITERDERGKSALPADLTLHLRFQTTKSGDTIELYDQTTAP